MMAQRLLAASTRIVGGFAGCRISGHAVSLPLGSATTQLLFLEKGGPPQRTFERFMRQSSSKAGTSQERWKEASKKLIDKNKLEQNSVKLPIRELAALYKDGDLDLSPRYQRNFVWELHRASRLVITALSGRFVPCVVLHEREEGRYDVLDGKQRLISLLSFYMAGNEEFLTAYSSLKASMPEGTELPEQLKLKDENYEDINGLTFKDLDGSNQKALKRFAIDCLIIPRKTPREIIFLVYEDINSGGLDLTAQQVRRAAFYGPYIELLDELVENEDFQCIRDPQNFRRGKYEICSNEHDRELILRAFAFSSDSGKGLKGKALKMYLNRELDRGLDDRSRKYKKAEFEFVMRVWRSVFGTEDGAFREFKEETDGQWTWKTKKRYGTSIQFRVWEATYAALAELKSHGYKESQFVTNQASIIKAMKGLFRPNQKLDLANPTTSKFMRNKDAILSAIRPCLDPLNTEHRGFRESDVLRQELFTKQGGKCTVCGEKIDESRINDGKYVHLDHVKPYSKGGLSTPDNAALTHKACNLEKGARY